MKKSKSNKRLFDWLFLGSILMLLFFGILMVYEASSVSAAVDFGDKYYFLKEQLKWAFLGIVAMGITAFIDYRRYYSLAVPILLVTILLLLLVFIPGLGVKALGAHRWINFRLFILQPSELTKLAAINYLSAWLSFKEKGRFTAFLILTGTLVGLVLLEPDLGTAFVIIAVSLAVYFISGAPLKHFAALLPVSILGVIGLALSAPYRFRRLTTFLNPNSDPLGASYHIRQILIGLGSGGMFGVGLGKSRQKFAYLPEATTDSIFAIIAEELGFIGSIFIIGIFFLLIYRGFQIAQKAPDSFGRLLGSGIITWIAIQTLVNLGSMVAIVPLTGIPLPFISYGGSSLVVMLTACGIMLNIERAGRKK
ncbi:MAG: putative lipid II flippase FtsW [Patescibacteria group bacterium]|nr:putative lipid II flippase FtsW [Patescibacteria group bacterium]